jgi:hypothetical protein
MAHISYIGRNGGSNTDLEAAKTEALQLANELTRAKIAKMNGAVVEKREVAFVINFALTTTRERILRIPQMVANELRGFEHAKVHAIRMRIDSAIRRDLEVLAETLAKAVEADDFFADLIAEEKTAEQKAERERKRDIVNAKRRAKYHRKHAD